MYNAIDRAMTKNFEKAVRKHGLADYKDKLLNLAQNCIMMTAREADARDRIGSSRLGGLPDVVTGFIWPEDKSFMAQLNLADLVNFDINNLLPKKGMLYFFLGSDESCSNLPVTVLWSDASPSALSPATPPDGYEYVSSGADPGQVAPRIIYEPFAFKMAKSISLPNIGTHLYNNLFDEEGDDYSELEDGYTALCDELNSESESVLGLSEDRDGAGVHRLFGYAASMVEELEVVACYNRLKVDPDFYWLSVEKVDELIAEIRNSRASNDDYLLEKREQQRSGLIQIGAQKLKEYSDGVDDWTLLFQLDSDLNSGMCFWDAGLVHCLMDKNELSNLRFDSVYAELTTF